MNHDNPQRHILDGGAIRRSRWTTILILITVALFHCYSDFLSVDWLFRDYVPELATGTDIQLEYLQENVQHLRQNQSWNHTIDLKPPFKVSNELCTREQVRRGSWYAAVYPSPPYTSKTVHLQCHPPEYYQTHSYDTFDWIPNDATRGHCLWTRWNAKEFCSLTRHAVVSIVGDSLSWEQYSSLLQLLHQRVHQTDQHRSKSLKQNHIQSACVQRQPHSNFPSRVRIVFRNDPRLEFVNESIRENFPLILILNRGAHYVPDAELEENMRHLVTILLGWQETCSRNNVACHLFWRTTVPGHPQCDPETEVEPMNDLAAMEARVEDRSRYNRTGISMDFHWYDFQRQNELVLRILKDSDLRHTVLDAYYINILRPDGHRSREDCLHSCYPGKMDIYNQLLLHFLKLERTPQQIDQLQALYQKTVKRLHQRHQSTSPQTQGIAGA